MMLIIHPVDGTGWKNSYISPVSYTHLDVYKRQVLIHDGARPLVDNEILVRSMHTVEKEKACVAGMPVKDTIKVSDELGYSANTPDRKSLWQIQTCLLYTSRCV